MGLFIRKIEELTITELYRILKLRSEVFVVEQNCVYLDPDGADEKAYHVFIEEKGEIQAYCRILGKGITFPEIAIGRVVVKKTARGKGYSKTLMQAAMRFVEEALGEKEIQIAAQAYLIKFYGALGFVAISEEYLEDGIPHINMIYKK